MNYFENNVDCIQRYRKYLYDTMKDKDILTTSNHVELIRSVVTKNSEQAVIIQYHSKEYRLNSLYNPSQEAKKWIEQYKFLNTNNIISIFGFGNGIFARTIIGNMGKNDVLLIYEPSASVFHHVLENYDITDILMNNRVALSVESINDFEFHNSLQRVMNIRNMSEQIICIHPQYDILFAESCILFWKELKDAYNHTRININTGIIFGKKMINNTLSNIKFLSNSNTLMELKREIPADIPAIIVSAGPSVEKHIDNLKKAKGKSIIIAVDRILDYLLDNGIEPDFVVTLDPMKPLRCFSIRDNIKIPLICFMEANNDIFEVHKGRKFICNCTRFLNKLYTDIKKNPPNTTSSASVSTLAFTVSVELGIKSVILIGQDLAYYGKQSHAGGIKEDLGEAKNIMVEDIHGNMIKSRYDWREFIIWYQDMLTIYPYINLIDVKEQGAKIKGAKIMTFEEVLDKYCIKEIDCKKIIDSLNLTFNKEQVGDIIKYMEDNILILEKIKKKSIKAVKLCDILIHESEKSIIETKEYLDAFKKLSNINKYIYRQPIYSIMDNYIIADAAQHLLEICHFTEDIQSNSIKTFKKTKSVFKAMIDATEYIKPRLQKTIDDMVMNQNI